MTPKDKAKYLIDKYTLLVPIDFGGMHIDLAKECVIVAADEILQIDWFIPTLEDKKKFDNYWQEVKFEIAKL